MKDNLLPHDPYNVIITGVGGQGNVMASRVVGNMLSRKGYHVIIGETFGASQRGGSVMSHLRLSTDSHWSPQIPKGRCHLVISLEPTEALRVLMHYGNPRVIVLSNTRPVHAISVISGDNPYPDMEQIQAWLEELTADFRMIAATESALELGNPILSNLVLVGAVAGLGVLPLDRGNFEAVITQILSHDMLALNLKAYDMGYRMVQ